MALDSHGQRDARQKFSAAQQRTRLLPRMRVAENLGGEASPVGPTILYRKLGGTEKQNNLEPGGAAREKLVAKENTRTDRNRQHGLSGAILPEAIRLEGMARQFAAAPIISSQKAKYGTLWYGFDVDGPWAKGILPLRTARVSS